MTSDMMHLETELNHKVLNNRGGNYMSLQFGNKQTPYLERLYKVSKTNCMAGVYYSVKKKRLIRYSYYHKDYKKFANRNLRRNHKDIQLKGKQYRKYYELEWSVI